MKKRVVPLMLLGALLFLALPAIAAAASQFTDIQNHWAKDNILSLASKGFIDGYPDGTFQPDKPISRAEFTCILLNGMGITPSSSSATAAFSDTSTHWAHAQIAEAVQKGILIVSEYPKGLKPDDPILRSEAAAMMVRALGEQPDLTATTFKDSAQVAKSMYRGYIKTAYTEGLMHGYTDGTFLPYSGVKRGEACAMLSNLLNKTGTPATPNQGSTSDNPGATGLVLQSTRYDLASAPVYLKQNNTNVRIISLSLAGKLILINSSFPFPQNAASGNPDLVINNTRYENCGLSISGSDVLATPAGIKLDSLTYNSYKYNADFVKLYIGIKNSSCYLSDAELVDTHTVKVSSTSYDINNTQVAVALGSDFYAITGISFSSSGVNLSLTAIPPVVMNSLNLSDISSILVDNQSLSLSSINTLFFIVNGEKYNLSNVTIDASGNFIDDDKTYAPDQVAMVINTTFYKLSNLQITNKKFFFYCTESSADSWVRINDKYQNASDVQIIMGGDTYSLDKLLVVKRNVIRINNHQYTVNNSGFLCWIDSIPYAINNIDYDTNLQITIIDATKSSGTLTTGGITSQPEEYVFYLNNAVYQDGAGSTDTIYAGGGWRSFDSITFTDQSHFTYNSTTYSLVNSKVQISGIQFVITDFAWRVSSQTLEIYLQRS